MTPVHEFLSPAWLDVLAEIIEEEVARVGVPGGRFTLCEVIAGVPERGTVAWHCHVDEQGVRLVEGVVDDADHRLTVDHGVALRLARTVLGDPEGRALATELVTEAMADGRFEVASTGPLPSAFTAAHDRIALLTAEC